ncbi:uncharacterized protein ATNIH1004_002325 [Aspergillus tanneri]|uniref:Uncharacterized protein n=1 Tax=Aspergillus tanneri TaxID=1220188 RepID=A0A5M9MWA9_9EURO|nr:uncharacterized protein ATNIH1004_002325 [Aspergillus tanneri]KAA8649654.1 hypothetical protein ATNIH1004_002325 [Aspergillus tanneri]
MPKSKRRTRATRRRNTRQEPQHEEAAENEEQPTGTNNDEDVDMDRELKDLDSDFEKLSDDEAPTAQKRRHKKARIDALPKTNQRIKKANIEHNVSPERNLLPEKIYRITYDSWSAYMDSGMVEDDPESGWKAYDKLYKSFYLINRGNSLPEDWNIPQTLPYSDLGNDRKAWGSFLLWMIQTLQLNTRMTPNLTSQTLMIYFRPVWLKRNPIYRVRAGSSEPYDPQTAELVLSNTRGNSKSTLTTDGILQEVWKYSRDDVSDITGVGWKVEDDDEANTNALALIRPQRYATYPHTRVLVKWKDGNTTLERRGFVRRIANGNSFNGDRMIYLKAKELENAYWGYNVEEHWDHDSDDSHDKSSDESSSRTYSSRPRKAPSKSRRGVRNVESEYEENDTDSDTSLSSLEQARKTRRSSRRTRTRKSKPPNKNAAIDAEIRLLTKELNRLQVKRQRGSRDDKTVSRSRRRKNLG